MRLKAIDGTLYYTLADIHDAQQREWADGQDVILLCIYDAGDCDTISWPEFDATHLRCALYDGRESGMLDGHASSVTLPNGVEFSI